MVEHIKVSEYENMVITAIKSLKDFQGSRPKDIAGFIKNKWDVKCTDQSNKSSVHRALKKGMNDNLIVKTSSGLYTLATRLKRRSFRRRKKAKRRGGRRKSKRKKSGRRKKGRKVRRKRKKAKRSQSGSLTQVKRKKRRRVKKSASGSQSQIKRKGKRTRRRNRIEDEDGLIRRRKVNPDTEIPKRQKKNIDLSSK